MGARAGFLRMTSISSYAAVIVGAGQAGLAAAHGLIREGLVPGRDFVLIDSNDGPGGAWRHRWDTLTLGTVHGIADLPGLALGRPAPNVPASQVIADYYGRYEKRFGLEVLRPARVTAVRDAGGPLRVEAQLPGRELVLHTRYLINASGTWTHPFIPQIPGIRDFRGEQLHTVSFTRPEDFEGRRTLVVGGGMSAVQFLMELAPHTETLWATRNPPNFRDFRPGWGLDVENRIRERSEMGLAPESIVGSTGIPLLPRYLDGVRSGVLVSRGMIDGITASGVRFSGAPPVSAPDPLIAPDSWRPARGIEDVDVIFWNTGFRPALGHLAPLHLRTRGGGLRVQREVEVENEPRVLLVGYAASASTIGATRAGRRAARVVGARLSAGSQVPSRHNAV